MPQGIPRAQWDQRNLECRGMLRHSWHWIPVPANERPREGVAVWLRCERCTSERHDVYRYYDGSLISRRYAYPDAYKGWSVDTNGDRITTDEIRKRYLKIIRERTKETNGHGTARAKPARRAVAS